MYEKYLGTSDILIKIAGQWSASLLKTHDFAGVFRTLATVNQLGFYVSETLAAKGLIY